MNYEKIILELMGRIQNLEETVGALDQRISLMEGEADERIDSVSVSNPEKITRTAARKEAMDKIQELYPDYYVSTASRSEGSGIKVIKGDSEPKRAVIIKFYHSKIYLPNSGLTNQSGEYEHGWHIVRLDEVIGSIFDFCLFSMCGSNGRWHFFLFEPDQLGVYNDENRKKRDDELWLNFSVQGDFAYELREEKNDVTEHLDNWDVLENYKG